MRSANNILVIALLFIALLTCSCIEKAKKKGPLRYDGPMLTVEEESALREEAEIEAAETITEENAREEFAKLAREIEADIKPPK